MQDFSSILFDMRISATDLEDGNGKKLMFFLLAGNRIMNFPRVLFVASTFVRRPFTYNMQIFFTTL